MARYNEIQSGRFNRYLQKLLSMKGPAALETLNPELYLQLPVMVGVEDRYLQGWDRFGFFGSTTDGGGGTFAAFQFTNPANSGVIAVFEKIMVYRAGGAVNLAEISLSQASGQVALATGVPSNNLNLDLRGRTGCTLTISKEQSAGSSRIGNTFSRAGLTGNTSYDFITHEDHQLPLCSLVSAASSQSLRIVNENSGANLSVSVLWRERLLEDSERS